MYWLGKEEVASCLDVLGKRWDGVSNNPVCQAVCCFHAGGNLWKQQHKDKVKKCRRRSSKQSLICLRRLSEKDKWWAAKRIPSEVTLMARRTLRKRWSGLPYSTLTKMRGETV